MKTKNLYIHTRFKNNNNNNKRTIDIPRDLSSSHITNNNTQKVKF